MSVSDRPDPFFGDSARRAGGASWLGAGLGRGHSRGAADDAFAYQGDSAGVRNWAKQRGWTPAPQVPPVVAEVIEAAPVPLGPEYVPTDVMTGQFDGWAAVAFNVGVTSANGVVPKWAMTAVGRGEVGPAFWLHPRRLSRFSHRGGSLTELDLGGSRLGDRWSVSAYGAEDTVLALVQAPPVEEALLATDDGDELWATDTALAALRVDNHRPALLEHHLRLLTLLAAAETTDGESR